MIYFKKEGNSLNRGLNILWIGGPTFKLVFGNICYYLRIRFRKFHVYYGKVYKSPIILPGWWYK